MTEGYEEMQCGIWTTSSNIVLWRSPLPDVFAKISFWTRHPCSFVGFFFFALC